MQFKICTTCNKKKKLSKFVKDKYTKDGHRPDCANCKNNKEKKFRIKFPWKSVFSHVKQRCNNPKNPKYHRYGGRGIECRITEDELKKLWYRDKAYLMEKPSIDREDNDGDYVYGNCRFIELVDNIKKSYIDNPRTKIILQFDLEGNFIKEWISQTEASKSLNISQGDIGSVASGKRKTCGNFMWRFKNVF